MIQVIYKTLGTQTARVLCESILPSEEGGRLELCLGARCIVMNFEQLVSIKSVMTKMSKVAVKANHTRKVKPTTPEA